MVLTHTARILTTYDHCYAMLSLCFTLCVSLPPRLSFANIFSFILSMHQALGRIHVDNIQNYRSHTCMATWVTYCHHVGMLTVSLLAFFLLDQHSSFDSWEGGGKNTETVVVLWPQGPRATIYNTLKILLSDRNILCSLVYRR